jgi:hypothetical protein
MKIKALFTMLLLAGSLAARAAQATILLNNYDSGQPAWYGWGDWRPPGTPELQLAPREGFWVELLANGQPISATDTKATKFNLSEPGFFDAGVGVIPGVAPGGMADFTLRIWKDAPAYEQACSCSIGSIQWRQATGSWNDTAAPPLPPTGPILAIPGQWGVIWIPEPSTALLLAVGGGLWRLGHRRITGRKS